MSRRRLRAWIEVELTRGTAAAEVTCPGCGLGWEIQWPAPVGSFPAGVRDCCDSPGGCGMTLLLQAVGWRTDAPAPCPQAPAPADLSDRARLERIWQIPTGQQPPQLQALPSVLAPTAGSRRADRGGAVLAAPAAPPAPPPSPRPRPCPADVQRHRLADWSRSGWLPEGVAPCAIAAAYRRRFGTEPRRHAKHRQSRAYTLRELGLALGGLGMAPNREPLRVVWHRTLEQLEGLPSTRMLLKQQARLTDLREGPGGLLAVVRVPEQWLPMVRSRAHLLSDALAAALGGPVALELVEVEL